MAQSTCEKCAGPALTIDELNERSKSLGMFVQPDGTIIAPASHKSQAHELENLKGFQCAKCGRIYCMGCILTSAPSHANGGKACFECRSSYKLLANAGV
jgi:hypothetical protein